MKLKSICLFFLCVIMFSLASASIKMPLIFTDNMVLQQRSEVPVWGDAMPNHEVRLITSWDNRIYTTFSDSNGKWQVKLSTPCAGGPYSIKITDDTEFTLDNILLGEVWLCSGQSNMEMPVGSWGKIDNYEVEIASAEYPRIRLMHIDRATSTFPLDDLEKTHGGWRLCSPATIKNFSAVAYFFGRNLYQNLNVPIGLITASWGGTVAEAWTSSEALKQMPDFKEAIQQITTGDEVNHPVETKSPGDGPNKPAVLFNAMIHPIIPYAIRGVIWYQGEYNCARAYQYKDLFPLLIADWRKQWNCDLPFYFVQLPNFGERNNLPENAQWAELREAQLKTLCVANTGMAVTIELGDTKDVHPKSKQDVGIRLALIARAKTYDEKISYSGPLYHSHCIEGSKIRLRFDHADGGLKVGEGFLLKGFSIAGPDHQSHWADAVIEGDEVVVSSPFVTYPLSVRYAWAANPECNLFNGADLPASPFRTDNWNF